MRAAGPLGSRDRATTCLGWSPPWRVRLLRVVVAEGVLERYPFHACERLAIAVKG